MSFEWFVGFANGASHHTFNLASAAWVIYSPSGQLVASGGAFLGPSTNNVAEYVDVVVTSECIHLYSLSIVTRCLFQDVIESCHTRCLFREVSLMRKSCQFIVGNPPICKGLKSPKLWGPWVIRLS